MNIYKKYYSIIDYSLKSPQKMAKICQVKRSKLTYLNLDKLINLSNCVVKVEENHIPGKFIEAGCALGGSAIVISLNKKRNRKFEIYDTFAQIPPPSLNDEYDSIQRYQQIIDGNATGIKNDRYYGYEDNLLGKVVENFNKFNLSICENNISFHKGLFEDTLRISDPVALAHIDSDWYDSIITSLNQVVPMLSINGVIIIDDYDDWRGAKKAVNDYFKRITEHFQFSYYPQLVIKKIY